VFASIHLHYGQMLTESVVHFFNFFCSIAISSTCEMEKIAYARRTPSYLSNPVGWRPIVGVLGMLRLQSLRKLDKEYERANIVCLLTHLIENFDHEPAGVGGKISSAQNHKIYDVH